MPKDRKQQPRTVNVRHSPAKTAAGAGGASRAKMRSAAKAARNVAADAAEAKVPFCRVARTGGSLTIRQTVEGVLSAGGLYEVTPVFGATNPTPEERWTMVSPSSGEAEHVMRTPPGQLVGDGIIFQINVCAHVADRPEGDVTITIEQDGVDRPITPPMTWSLSDVALCQSAGDKLTPTQISGGFAILFDEG